MKKKTYHHGHLRNALIESGIRLLNREGIEGFSLRKVAARCGVSSSAPYTHFKGKDDLLAAMETHVNAKLLWHLYPVLRRNAEYSGKDFLLSLSLSYAAFFLENPHYFSFLFLTGKGRLPLSLSQTLSGRRLPFLRLYQSCCRILSQIGCPKEQQESRILSYLAALHGLLFFVHSPVFYYDKDWESQLVPILSPALETLLSPISPSP